jgi:hypothetical protein
MEYIIVENHILQIFIGAVNQKIVEGWTPLGGVATDTVDGTSYYTQAMTRYPSSQEQT